MYEDKIKEVLEMVEIMRHIFVATADKEGLPHLTAAGKMTPGPNGLLAVTSWFCPQAVLNLAVNKNISLVVWDAKNDVGYQLLGKVEDMRELGILDGFAKEETKRIFPQVQRQLLVRVGKVIGFKHAPHSDTE